MPKADICYFFTVSLEEATERNRSRIKENKETDMMISARFKSNLNYKPLARKVIRFNNSGDFKKKRRELFNSVWQEISGCY